MGKGLSRGTIRDGLGAVALQAPGRCAPRPRRVARPCSMGWRCSPTARAHGAAVLPWLPLHETAAPQQRPGRANQGRAVAGGDKRQELAPRSMARVGVLHYTRWCPAPPPRWRRDLQIPAKPLQPLPYFFLTSCCTKGCLEASTAQALAESTLQWALGCHWEPHTCCSLHSGCRGDPGIWAAWQGPGARGPGRGWSRAAPAQSCTHCILLWSDAAHGEHKLDSPPWLWAPAKCCPWGRGLGGVRSSSAKKRKFDCWMLNVRGIGPIQCHCPGFIDFQECLWSG